MATHTIGVRSIISQSAITLTKENETWTTRKSRVVLNAECRFGINPSATTVRKDERLSVSLIRKVLVIAILVGLCNTMSVSQAAAPNLSMEIWVQNHPKSFAYQKVMQQWRSKAHYSCLVQLWNRESHWNPLAHNKSSGAFGIAQFMPTTWANYHLPYKTRLASVQITGGLRYITKRYGTPCAAWKFWQKNYWY